MSSKLEVRVLYGGFGARLPKVTILGLIHRDSMGRTGNFLFIGNCTESIAYRWRGAPPVSCLLSSAAPADC
jgi:hypothetical protein